MGHHKKRNGIMNKFLISILAFAFLGINSQCFAQKTLDAAIEDLAIQIDTSIPKEQKKKIGVLPFDLDDQICNSGIYLSEILTTKLFRLGKFEIIEKAHMDKILKELEIHEKGHIDESTAKKTGRILGVDAIIVGKIADLNHNIEINCRLIDILTGKVLAVANVKVVKDYDVKKLLEQPCRGTEGLTQEPPIQIININRTLYFGGDWPTVKLKSAEIIESKFIRFNFEFINPFEDKVRINLDQPEENTYIVDNLGNSYNFVSSQGVRSNERVELRPRERINVSIILNAHKKPAKRITLRTKWRAYGSGIQDIKEFVVKDIPIAGQ